MSKRWEHSFDNSVYNLLDLYSISINRSKMSASKL
jgi:hypothetical protein